MLLNLKIRDFAIIDEVELDLQRGFTVVTGETGAGKSILVNALTLVLGGKANTEVIRNGAQTAEVEALFDISAQPIVKARLDQRELVGDDPDLLLVRRVIGKGRGKVVLNGRLATVATLGEIVRTLVDISGQHEQQSLLVVENHIELLDAFGRLDEPKARYRTAHEALRRVVRERQQLARGEQEALQRGDYLRFQIEEIDQLAPLDGEEDQLTVEQRKLTHADRLQRGGASAEALIYSEDGSAFDKLSKAALEIEALARLDGDLAGVAQALESARREASEAARSLQRYLGTVEADPARLDAVEERLAALRQICRKHDTDLGGILARQAELCAELEAIDNSDARLLELEREIEKLDGEALSAARTLSKGRKQAAVRLKKAVEAELKDMDLAGALFEPTAVQREAAGVDLGPNGLDEVELLWSANKGEPPRPLARIASGGELSRLMLAVKRVLSSRDLVSLYVFDEVDTGLGGRVADSIGRKIREVAKDHQAIAITHLAPIAACAHQHLSVHKESRGKRTVSRVVVLSEGERTEEIARMIDGSNLTATTRRAAKEMLGRGS